MCCHLICYRVYFKRSSDFVPGMWECMCVFEVGFNKSWGTWDFISGAHWIIEKAKVHGKEVIMCFTNYRKVFDYVNHIKLGNVLRKMGIPGYLIALMKELFIWMSCRLWPISTSLSSLLAFVFNFSSFCPGNGCEVGTEEQGKIEC